jgi:glycosyltransferase involved in cell wall biosynthesis
MAHTSPEARVARLIVFSDDWGRHPSSCQHLVRRLAVRHPTLWVNTIGTRAPRLSRGDVAKATQRLQQWLSLPAASIEPDNLTVIAPVMWPRFRHVWEQRLNGALIGRAVRAALAGAARRNGAQRCIALTTAPIGGALLDHLSADAWVYYRVDDVTAWPDLSSAAMRALEQRLLGRADRVIAASRVLQTTATGSRHPPALLTHGVDLEHWGGLGNGAAVTPVTPPAWAQRLTRPVVAFWGLIDRRLDTAWLRALADLGRATPISLVLVGPTLEPDPAIARLPAVCLPGALPYDELPGVAAAADVLIMPYTDTPATRAMQPLKLKEYLATDKPVVVRRLPATIEWSDAADVVDSAEEFARVVAERARSGLPESQRRARRRLVDESWDAKARLFEALLLDSLS